MVRLEEYVDIVGASPIEELHMLADRTRGQVIQNINSTAVGGGVAEILSRMIPLLKQLGTDARWDVIKGDEKFFAITKAMHNALHGADVRLTREELSHFLEVNEHNATELDLSGDVIFVHDPQPVALVAKKETIGRKWLWRCHIDFSQPEPSLWEFLRLWVQRYDAAVFSAPAFGRQLDIPQILIAPSIDPLSDKNKDLPNETVDEVFARFKIDRGRPVVTQISRFDYLKDPVGVVNAYKLVKPYMDCQLVLAGGGATDDPEGLEVLAKVRAAAESDPDIFVLFLPPASDIEINALQRGSDIVLQKSLKEGFGLTVAEALWKSRPVIASAVGGIPLQITHLQSGILTYTIEGTAYWIKQLLAEPGYAAQLGKVGREHIRHNFLLTRHLRDYLMAFLSLRYSGDIVHA
jgi:trehalose synthase